METLDTGKYSDGATGTCTREQFIAALRTYGGVPFRHQGRTRLGLDCAGLLWAGIRDCGMENWDLEKHIGYERIPDGKTVNRIMAALMDKVPAVDENLRPGNVVQLAYRTGGRDLVTHMGILTDWCGGLGLIHAYFPKGEVVEHVFDEAWKRRTTAIFVPRGLV